VNKEKLFHVEFDALPPLVAPEDAPPICIEIDIIDYDALPLLDQCSTAGNIDLSQYICVDETAPFVESSIADIDVMKAQILARSREICADTELATIDHQTTH
jgi:hypothetical protein